VKKEKNKLIIIIVIAILLICGVILYIIKNNKKEYVKDDIYERAYDNIGFKEDTSLSKVHCYKNISNGSEVEDKKTIIYYYNKSNLVTYIIHNEITLSDEYMDYYDEMYNAHKESLEKNYNYRNVRINIEKDKNKILDTVIVTKSTVENMYSMPKIYSVNDAKKIANSNGFTCK